ncbi:MAG: hypothetical protein ACRD2X_21940 [Vicinamibacteraceae bacterium]
MQYEKPELIAVGSALGLVLEIRPTGTPDGGVEPQLDSDLPSFAGLDD